MDKYTGNDKKVSIYQKNQVFAWSSEPTSED